MEVPNLSDRKYIYIYTYKHGLQSLSLTMVLATKNLLSIHNLLDEVNEFIKREISLQKKKKIAANRGVAEGKGKKPYRNQEHGRQPIRERLSYPYN